MTNPLFWNFVIYLVYFFLIFKREKNRLTVYSLIFLYELIVSFLGFYTFETGIYQRQFGSHKESELSFLPYFFNFIAVLIVTIPLKGLKINQALLEDERNQKGMYKFLTYSVCAMTIIYSVALYFFSRLLSGMSFDEIYEANHSGEIGTFGIPILDFILLKVYQIINILTPFVLSYLFVKLAKKENVKSSIITILLIFLPQLFTCIMMAARGRMFFLFTNILFYIVLFYSNFNKKTKRIIMRVGVASVLLACIYAFLISASRTGSSSTSTIDGIARYFGEPYPNLSVLYWNASEIRHPYGARHFYGVYKFYDDNLDLDTGLEGRHNFWTSYTNVPIYNFKTLYGDLYIEYGMFFPFIFLGISTCVYLYLRKKMKGSLKIVMMYLCYHIGVFGLFDYIADIGFRELIIALIIISLIKIFSKKQKRIKTKLLYESSKNNCRNRLQSQR